MRGAPVGDIVGIYFDGAADIEKDDVVVTESGKHYRVVSKRVQEKGKAIGRQHLKVLVISPDEVGPEDTVHTLHWYARSKR